MSPAQHTPGWLPPLDPYKGSGRTLTINGVPALLVKRVLAESDRFCPVTLAQADVFARLFAAATDLLAALEECEAFIRGLRMAQLVGNYCIDADYRLHKAAKAIAKAKGGI